MSGRTRAYARAAAFPVVVMVIGGAVAKWLDATAGAAIVAAGTLLLGRVLPQPGRLRKGADDGTA